MPAFPGRSRRRSARREAAQARSSRSGRAAGRLTHGCATGSARSGGISTIYGAGSLNLGWTADDDPAHVAENRRRFVQAVCGDAEPQLVTIRQTHGPETRVVEASAGELQTPEGKAVLQGDGLMTDVPGVLLGVQVADCVPVLVADPRRKAVAAFHAGWRGTASRIVEEGIRTMAARYGSNPEDLVAAVGPSIGACCYCVGDEVKRQFQAEFAYAGELFEELSGREYLNLWKANARQLEDAGLLVSRISVIAECTACTKTPSGTMKYFSHRQEAGATGRMMAVIGVGAE